MISNPEPVLDPVDRSYQRNILFQTDEFEIVSIIWTSKSISPMHNHGWSQCLVLVEDGEFENILDLGVSTEVQILKPGGVITTPIGARHEIRCLTSVGKTLHVYAPKIKELVTEGKFNSEGLDSVQKELRLQSPTPICELRGLLKKLREQSVSVHSPYFMNQLFSGVVPQMLMAEEFLAQTKTTLATFEASPVLSRIETEVMESLGEIIGWEMAQRHGVSVPGGSAANFMALHCAKHRCLPEAKSQGLLKALLQRQRQKLDQKQLQSQTQSHIQVQAQLQTLPLLKVFVAEEAHYSFKKACMSLGLGLESLVRVPSDKNGKVKINELDQMIDRSKSDGHIPVMVVATAGTTVLGAFDDIDSVAAVSRKHGVWFHVDAAWGGPALFSKQLRPLMTGIEKADSVTFDGHKLFGAQLTSSFFLTRHKDILYEANDVADGEYLFHSDDPELDKGKLSWQCGRKAEAISFWAIWKSVGTEGLGKFVDKLIAVRSKTLSFISENPRLELVTEPEFLNVCVRVLPPKGTNDSDWSKKVRERLKQENKTMVNYSSDSKGSFLRLILTHPFLEYKHVEKILTWALEIGLY